MAAGGGARRGRGNRDVVAPFSRNLLAPARRHAHRSLARIRRLGQSNPARARAHRRRRRGCSGSTRIGSRMGRGCGRALPDRVVLSGANVATPSSPQTGTCRLFQRCRAPDADRVHWNGFARQYSMAKASQARRAPQQKARTSGPSTRPAPKRRAAAKRETTDAVVVWIERRPLQALALALGLGLVLGVAWRL